MIPPCKNCGQDNCHFCHLARTNPKYAALYREDDFPFASTDCIYRGGEVGRKPCESCGGKVEVKIFGCEKYGSCSIDKDVGESVCSRCPSKTAVKLHEAYDWHDLSIAVPGKTRKFNSSLLRFGGELILATRVHTKSGWSAGRIVLSKLDNSFQRTGANVELAIRHPLAIMGIEDPRLFVHAGRLHVAFTGVRSVGDGIATSQLYARLGDDLQAEEVFYPEYANRQPWEKNWGFFSEGGQLYAVYQIAGQQILRIDGNHAELAYQSDTTWPDAIGLPRGGSSPIKRGNEYYSFFHDVIDRERREYRVCLYTFDDKPPFRVNRIARVPLFESDKRHRPAGEDWVPDVVFPCGAFLEDNLWHVSAGYYDHWSWLLRFDVNRCEELLDVAVKGRDSGLNLSASCLTPHQSYDVWANVYNRNEYELPERMDGWEVVDIGGHIGSFAKLCLDRGASRVVSAEPLKENCEAYRHNLQEHAGKWELVQAAAYGGEPPAAATMGGYSLLEVGDWERVPVDTIHLGKLDCDLLKMDVEGAEYELIRNTDLSGVKRIVGEGHLFDGLPGADWLKSELERRGFRVRVRETGPLTYLFWAER